ncbi:MAG TPA: DUF2934 domain-containing protein [Rubrivivax sp.]|nr:DUF2934 domain-containing protein [Rubrivivax sp.]
MKRKQPASRGGEPPPAPVQSTAQAAAAPDDDLDTQIREAAYYRYLARGAVVGHEMEDWLRAEAELLDARKADDRTH